jgi:RPA family protein
MATEPKKAKRTDFMKLSSTIRTNRTFTGKQLASLATAIVNKIDDDTTLNEIAKAAQQRIEEIKKDLVAKQKAIIAKAQAKIAELEGKQPK